MAISLSNANSYFNPKNHVKSAVWEGFGEPEREAGIAHAKRIVSRAIQVDVDEEVADMDITSDAYYRPDYAVYEQALFMLANSQAIPNAEQTAPHWIANDGTNQPSGVKSGAEDIFSLCPEAAQYLRRPGRQVELLRG